MSGAAVSVEKPDRHVGRIPVRNIWLLFLYAADLAKFFGRFDAEIEEAPDFPDLIARLLCHATEMRLRRNLSRGYRRREAVLTRVRGRIDVLRTYSQDLLRQGKVACRYEEHTIDTARNRLVRAALDALAGRVGDVLLGHRCRKLAGDLGRQGVSGIRPSRAEIAADQISRHDAEDLLMVTLARLVFDLVLPTEDAGGHALSQVEKDEVLVRRLFEKAIGNFFAAELDAAEGWTVFQGKRLNWQIEGATGGIAAIVPGMVTDIVLENVGRNRRIVIDTKFTGIFTRSAYREAMLKSGYVYQIYAYLRSQECADDPLSLHSEGMMLHPAIDADVDETVRIQGHDIRFVTVDLAKPTSEVLERLRSLPLATS
ncbi:MAG: 5-methylcytosine-specific restriction endonuclease system specificity protein McrC [Chromatiaceae bacterium]|nr:5-methylcytosine-specific restriction endonuclease system specificity protein McrC [Chromatiaceae bacterium]